MTYEREELDTDRYVADFGVDVPAWVERDITLGQLDSIAEGGCASGAYMPAVTYFDARQTMGEHGDDVLEYIADAIGEVPPVPDDVRGSWDSMACHFLSMAVELWASGAAEDCRELFELSQDELEAEAEADAIDAADEADDADDADAPLWGVFNGGSDCMVGMLSPADARRTAQDIANRNRLSVWIGPDDGDAPMEEVRPVADDAPSERIGSAPFLSPAEPRRRFGS